MTKELTDADYETLAQFRALLRRFQAFSEEAARKVGITPQQHQALLAVKGFSTREALTIGDLAERLVIKHHSAVGLVDRLVKKGQLRRELDMKDRRRVALILTPSGAKLLSQISQANRDELRLLKPSLQNLLSQLGRRRK